MKHEPLTLIPPQFVCPLPPLQPAVFPPTMKEPPPPALDQVPWGTYVLDTFKEYHVLCYMACARRPGAAARVQADVSGEHCLQASFDARAASQAFERVHNTLSHRVKTEVPDGMQSQIFFFLSF